MTFDAKKCSYSHVGKKLMCDVTGKTCLGKSRNCIEDCEQILKEYYVYQEQIVELTEFAEQDFCKRCTVKDCKIFADGPFYNCMKLVKAFMDGEQIAYPPAPTPDDVRGVMRDEQNKQA